MVEELNHSCTGADPPITCAKRSLVMLLWLNVGFICVVRLKLCNCLNTMSKIVLQKVSVLPFLQYSALRLMSQDILTLPFPENVSQQLLKCSAVPSLVLQPWLALTEGLVQQSKYCSAHKSMHVRTP